MSDDISIAATVSAFKPCLHGEAVSYSAMMESTDTRAFVRVVAEGERLGNLCRCSTSHYATLDLLNETGDIIGDLTIPSRSAWEWCRSAFGLRAKLADCCRCAPSAYSNTYGASS